MKFKKLVLLAPPNDEKFMFLASPGSKGLLDLREKVTNSL